MLSRFSEWNVAFKTGSNWGMEQLSPVLEMFTQFLKTDVDALDFWSAQYQTTSLATAQGHLMPAGVLLQTLQQQTLGMIYKETITTDTLSVYVFTQGEETLCVVASRDSQNALSLTDVAFPEGTLIEGLQLTLDPSSTDGLFKSYTNLSPLEEPDARVRTNALSITTLQESATSLLLAPRDVVFLRFVSSTEPTLGTDGDDVFLAGALETAITGNGLDTLSYVDAASGVHVDWQQGSPLGRYEALHGSTWNDTLSGAHRADILLGARGNDHLFGREGNDTLYGGDWADTLHGHTGQNHLFGDNGSDALYGGANSDILTGGDLHDSLYGGTGNDALHGDHGHDLLAGGYDQDSLYGGIGNDRMRGENGMDYLAGSHGRDSLYGGEGTDTLEGQAGHDLLHGGDDADHVYGGSDRDSLYGGNDNDSLWGGTQNDRLHGDAQDDHLYGGAGDDALFGGSGQDILEGGTGKDRLDGGYHNDRLTGGMDGDVFVFKRASGYDIVTDFSPAEGDILALDKTLFSINTSLETVFTTAFTQTLAGLLLTTSTGDSLLLENVFTIPLDSLAWLA